MDAKRGDCGMHLLMAPSEEPQTRLSRKVMEAFLRYYFFFTEALQTQRGTGHS